MTHLVCFSDSRMTISQNALVESAQKYGIGCHIWRESDLPAWWFALYGKFTDQDIEKGYYCYAWKPFIVYETMKKLAKGDILIYADAGQQFVENPQHVIDEMTEDIFLFSNGWKNEDWSKMDVMLKINGGPTGPAEQVQASLMFFRVGDAALNFVEEWFILASVAHYIDNSPSHIPNVATFAETRWDQSIIGSMAIRDKLKLHWFPSTFYMNKRHEFPNLYPAITLHLRKRNNEW